VSSTARSLRSRPSSRPILSNTRTPTSTEAPRVRWRPEIAEAATGEGVALAGLGVDVGDEQADAIFEGVKTCGDLGEMFVQEMAAVAGGGDLPAAAMECFQAKLDDDLLRDVVMTRLVDGDAAFAGRPELTAKLMEIGRSCATA